MVRRGASAVFRNVRLLGAQDTLYAASTAARVMTSRTARRRRQYFADCYIEGHVDFHLWGCEGGVLRNWRDLAAIAHKEGGYPDGAEQYEGGAGWRVCFQSLSVDGWIRGDGAGRFILGGRGGIIRHDDFYEYGRWGRIDSAGGVVGRGKGLRSQRLQTATYAGVLLRRGPGLVRRRGSLDSKQLTAEEAKKYETKVYLAGKRMVWHPTRCIDLA